MIELIESWRSFLAVLRLYGDAFSSLNAPCSPEALRNAELALGFELPQSLAALLRLNNGQRLDGPPIFKSVSGWDRYRRHFFLDAETVVTAYKTFVEDELLLRELGDKEVPFASDRVPVTQGEVFSVNRESGRVSLIWTETFDPWNPPEWQLARFDRGTDLAGFVRWQIMLF